MPVADKELILRAVKLLEAHREANQTSKECRPRTVTSLKNFLKPASGVVYVASMFDALRENAIPTINIKVSEKNEEIFQDVKTLNLALWKRCSAKADTSRRKLLLADCERSEFEVLKSQINDWLKNKRPLPNDDPLNVMCEACSMECDNDIDKLISDLQDHNLIQISGDHVNYNLPGVDVLKKLKKMLGLFETKCEVDQVSLTVSRNSYLKESLTKLNDKITKKYRRRSAKLNIISFAKCLDVECNFKPQGRKPTRSCGRSRFSSRSRSRSRSYSRSRSNSRSRSYSRSRSNSYSPCRKNTHLQWNSTPSPSSSRVSLSTPVISTSHQTAGSDDDSDSQETPLSGQHPPVACLPPKFIPVDLCLESLYALNELYKNEDKPSSLSILKEVLSPICKILYVASPLLFGAKHKLPKDSIHIDKLLYSYEDEDQFYKSWKFHVGRRIPKIEDITLKAKSVIPFIMQQKQQTETSKIEMLGPALLDKSSKILYSFTKATLKRATNLAKKSNSVLVLGDEKIRQKIYKRVADAVLRKSQNELEPAHLTAAKFTNLLIESSFFRQTVDYIDLLNSLQSVGYCTIEDQKVTYPTGGFEIPTDDKFVGGSQNAETNFLFSFKKELNPVNLTSKLASKRSLRGRHCIGPSAKKRKTFV